MVVAECAGYPIDKVALLYETVVKMSPKTLTEGKDALVAAKAALKEKEDELAKKALEESKKVEKPVEEPKKEEVKSDRNKVKVIAESIKKVKEDTSDTLVEAKSALDYDIFLG
jgi:phage shock protein A